MGNVKIENSLLSNSAMVGRVSNGHDGETRFTQNKRLFREMANSQRNLWKGVYHCVALVGFLIWMCFEFEDSVNKSIKLLVNHVKTYRS